MRCSGCGNELPAWANGVCYVCGRIHQEQKRFGSHPAAPERARAAPTGPPAPAPNADVGGSGITLPLWLALAEASLPPEHCPVCGQGVPQDRLEEHIQIHRRRSATHRLPRRATKKPEPASGRRAEAPAVDLYARATHRETQQQVRRLGINRLLADIYGKPCLLSDILRGGGFSPADITKVHKAALTHFLDELLAVWQIAFAGESLAGGWVILTRSYGLDGNAPGVTAPT